MTKQEITLSYDTTTSIVVDDDEDCESFVSNNGPAAFFLKLDT